MSFDIQQQMQQRLAMEAAAKQMEFNTAQAIYADLVAGMRVGQTIPEGFREAANYARAAAPYLLEAFGLIKVEQSPTRTGSEEESTNLELHRE